MVAATASEVFVEVLRRENVKAVFGIVGSAFMDPLDLFPAAGLRFVSVRHEQNAALMAEGYARATGTVGVCIGQNGPGVTNLVTGVAQAFANHTPMVVITPSVTSASVGTYAIQEVDQMALFAGMTSAQFHVNRPDKLAWFMRNAFREAELSRGPVQVDIPRDFFYGVVDFDELDPQNYRTRRPSLRAPEDAVKQASRMLSAAENPVLLAGLGVVDSQCTADVAALAELLGAPVATVYQHNDAFSAGHRLGVGPIGYGGSKAAMETVSKADVIFAIGTRLNGFGTNPHYGFDYWPTHAQFIHNDVDAAQLGRNRPVAVALPGDAGEVVRQLIPTVVSNGRADGVAHELQQVKAAWEKELIELSSGDMQPMLPRRALLEISRAIPPEALVASDVGNVAGIVGAYIDFTEARQFLGPGTLGGIGVAYSAALGAKVGRPDRPVVAISGDGAWSMTMQEVMTAVSEGISVVGVLVNNGQYGAEKRNQFDYFEERYYATELENPNFAAIAEQMGAFAIRVEDPNKIAEAIQSAIDAGRASVVEIIVNPHELAEPYRRDAFQFPVRLLTRYAGGTPETQEG